jgi:plastocyanin
MKTHQRIAATVFALLLLLAVGLLWSTPGVGAGATGQIAGTVKLDGPAPHQKPIDMSKDPSCAQTRGGTPAAGESVVVGASGGLANVVVYISQGLSGDLPIPSKPVTFEQKGCQYVPHVVAVNPGQHMTILNDDKTMHNIHPEPKPGGGNNAFNKSQVVGAPPLDVTWASEEIAIPVKCNVHPWMHAFIVVVKGPNGVSDANGSFKLENVPPGTYTLTAWHEAFGTMTQKVTVAEGKPAAAEFSFKGK